MQGFVNMCTNFRIVIDVVLESTSKRFAWQAPTDITTQGHLLCSLNLPHREPRQTISI